MSANVMTKLDRVQSILYHMVKRLYVQMRFDREKAAEIIEKLFENKIDVKSIQVRCAMLEYLAEIDED